MPIVPVEEGGHDEALKVMFIYDVVRTDADVSYRGPGAPQWDQPEKNSDLAKN